MQNRHIYSILYNICINYKENWQKQVYDIKKLETILLAHIMMMIGR